MQTSFNPNGDIFSLGLDTIPFELGYHQVSTGSTVIPTATIGISRGNENRAVEAAQGDGAIEAAFNALDRIFRVNTKVLRYNTKNRGCGVKSEAEVVVTIEFQKGRSVKGVGSDRDVVKASILAYVAAYNKYFNRLFPKKSE